MDRVSVFEDSRLWTVEDFARWAGIPVKSVYYQVERRRIPGVVRFGKTLRIDPEVAIPALRQGIDVDAAREFLAEHLHGAVEIADDNVLDAAAGVLLNGKRAR